MNRKKSNSKYDKLIPPIEVMRAITLEQYILLCSKVGDEEADRLVDNAEVEKILKLVGKYGKYPLSRPYLSDN